MLLRGIHKIDENAHKLDRSAAGYVLAACLYISSACNPPVKTNTAEKHSPESRAETDRPTEDGEGFEGYLADPARISLEEISRAHDLQKAAVIGAAGTVASRQGGGPEGVLVGLWQVPIDASTPLGGQLSGKVLDCVRSDTKGGFKAKILWEMSRKYLVVTAGHPCPGKGFVVTRKEKTHPTSAVMNSFGDFESTITTPLVVVNGSSRRQNPERPDSESSTDPNPSRQDECRCVSGFWWDVASGTCQPGQFTNNCAPNPVCGCDGNDYASACEAFRAGITTITPGRC